jgi:LysM repeat protein
MPNTITIKSGDTLSALAQTYKTTVNDLLKLNPQIKNANLIQAGATLTLPSAPVVSTGGSNDLANKSILTPEQIAAGYSTEPGLYDPLTGKLKSTIPDYSKVDDYNSANAAINANQVNDAASKEANNEPPVRKTANDVLAEIMGTGKVDATKSAEENLTAAIAPDTAKPAVPDLTETYKGYRTEYGIDTLETSLTDLQKQEADLLAIKQARVNAEKGKTVATNVIEGRVGVAEQQENERITAVQNQITNVTNQLNVKYNVVSTLMGYTEKDYALASADYNSQMDNNISVFNALKGINDDVKSDLEKATDDARSSLQIVYNAIQSGGTSLSDISDTTKSLITKLEVQSGLPVGFYETLQNKNPKAEIVATYNWTSSDNTEYATILTKDATTGEIKTNNIALGKSKATSTVTKEEENAASQSNIKADLEAVKGADGYYNPDDILKIRDQIAVNDPGNLTWFDNAYPPNKMLNPDPKQTWNFKYLNSGKWVTTSAF